MKGVWGCAVVMTPFVQAIRRSLAYQFTLNAPNIEMTEEETTLTEKRNEKTIEKRFGLLTLLMIIEFGDCV